MISNKQKGQKLCPYCKEYFTKITQIQKTCTKIECLMRKVENVKKKEKKERKQNLKKVLVKKKIIKHEDLPVKPRSFFLKSAQDAFNEFIRLRDYDKPCISCGTVNDIQYHAGHFKSRGHANNLRFNPLNVHKQCVQCNDILSSNAIKYREELIKKIGLKKVEFLEQYTRVNKYSDKTLYKLAKVFRAKSRRLKRIIDERERSST